MTVARLPKSTLQEKWKTAFWMRMTRWFKTYRAITFDRHGRHKLAFNAMIQPVCVDRQASKETRPMEEGDACTEFRDLVLAGLASIGINSGDRASQYFAWQYICCRLTRWDPSKKVLQGLTRP